MVANQKGVDMAINFTVNGRPVSVSAPESTRLLWVLREELKLTGTKFGGGAGQGGHHDRRPFAQSHERPAESVARRERAAMRLLPVGPADERRGAARGKHAPDARGDQGPHERERVPLRNLSAYRARDRARRKGGLSDDDHHPA